MSGFCPTCFASPTSRLIRLDLIVLKLPLELFLEIFSYLNCHRNFIQRITCFETSLPFMEKEHVQRSTAIRTLTMTCWPLRNVLLPILWKEVEGCMVPKNPHFQYSYGLYDQCEYVLSNPIIAAYVQCVSSSLSPENMTHRI